MKINKKGEIKLAKNEIKIGEFIVSKETNHYKISTTSGNWTIRFAKTTINYNLIDAAIKEKQYNVLKNWIVVLYDVANVVPDDNFLSTIHTAAEECYARRPDLYVPQLSEQKDKEIIEEMKKEREILEKAKKEREQLQNTYKKN